MNTSLLFDIAVAILVFVAVPFIRSKTTEAQFARLKKWVDIAVTAAEQTIKGSGKGSEKKAYVLEWLKLNGIKFDYDKADLLIESKCFAMNQDKNKKQEVSE